MKISQKLRRMAHLFLFIAVIGIGLPRSVNAEEGPCEEALKRCIVDALLTSMAGANIAIAYASWCTVGYIWCVKYMD